MRKLFLFLFFLNFIKFSIGQEYVITLPKKNIINIENRNFYIKDVIDGRKDKKNIGFVQSGLLRKPENAIFEKGLEKELQTFFNKTLPKAEGQTAIIMKVNDIYISEETKIFKEEGVAKIKVDFFIEENGKLAKFHTCETKTSSEKFDVTKSQKESLKTVILYCLDELNYYLNNKKETLVFKEKKTVLNKEYTVDNITKEKRKKLKIHFLLGHKRTEGKNALRKGFTGHIYIKKDGILRNWFASVSLSYEKFFVDKALFEGTGLYTSVFSYSSLGISLFRRLYANFYLQLQVSAFQGKETLGDLFDRKQEYNIEGFNIMQSVIFLPTSKFGLYFSVGIKESWLNSKICKNDFGLNFGIGLKF